MCLTEFSDFGGESNSGSKWCILGIRRCLNPRRWSKCWILTRVVILTDDRCHTDDKFFDTENFFKISLKYKVVEKMVVDANGDVDADRWRLFRH